MTRYEPKHYENGTGSAANVKPDKSERSRFEELAIRLVNVPKREIDAERDREQHTKR